MSSYDKLKELIELGELDELDDEKYVISKDLKRYKDDKEEWTKFVENIEYIFVGDNPGTEEKNDEVYFSKNGKTGENIRNFAKDFLGLVDEALNEDDKAGKVEFNKKVLLLNKSLVYAKSTAELENPEDDKSLKLVAELINEIANEKKMSLMENKDWIICIFGVDSFYDDYFKVFFRVFNYDTNKENVGLYYHPSRRHPITKVKQGEIANKLGGKGNSACYEIKKRIFMKYGVGLYETYKNYDKKNLLDDVINKVLNEY